mgnify:CR=1 FL=1
MLGRACGFCPAVSRNISKLRACTGAGEVLYFLEIGIDAPLSGFMRDDGQAYSQFLVFVQFV